MSEHDCVHIRKLASGVPGLDQVIGEGIPEYSFNMIVGTPGTGKTTLAHQIMFANATPERRGLYFTILGEPALKMLRYQQQFRYFDQQRLADGTIQFVNLSEETLSQDLSHVLDTIVKHIEAVSPGFVVVDSFRTVVRLLPMIERAEMPMQAFIQHLALYLSSWQATTFLVGEYTESEVQNNPVFTVADGILWLFQALDRNSIVRKLQVVKMRGQEHMPGLHTFRITGGGVQVFPRITKRQDEEGIVRPAGRLSTGIPGLDEMLGGGIPRGDSALIAGPAGSGKTLFATQFIAQGVRQGEPGVIAVFEEHPADYLKRAKSLGFDLEAMVGQGQLRIIYLRPLDLSVDETLQEIREAVDATGAKRVAIDSLSGFELALAPTFREDFRESLYRMVGVLTRIGVTILMTVEVTESFSELHFSPHNISFLTDDVILQRYIELEGRLERFIAVVKMRSSAHSKELRAYEVTESGLVIGGLLDAYRGLITGVPVRREPPRPTYAGLTEQESAVLETLLELREATAEELAQRLGARRPDIARALDRLVALTYALEASDQGRAIYRPVARPLG